MLRGETCRTVHVAQCPHWLGWLTATPLPLRFPNVLCTHRHRPVSEDICCMKATIFSYPGVCVIPTYLSGQREGGTAVRWDNTGRGFRFLAFCSTLVAWAIFLSFSSCRPCWQTQMGVHRERGEHNDTNTVTFAFEFPFSSSDLIKDQ